MASLFRRPPEVEPAPKNGRALFLRPGRRRALVASAESGSGTDNRGLLRLNQPWQAEAMFIYRTVGECWLPAQYYSRAMERIRYYPAIRNDRGVPEEVESGPLVELFNRIRSPSGAPGDLSEIAGTYARLHFVIGDGNLTVTQEDREEVWEYLSPMELRLNPQGDRNKAQSYRRIRAPGALPEELTEAPDKEFEPLSGDDARVWRLWRRHPEYSQWADSPVRPVLDLYSLLNRLTLAVNAEASSRAAQRGLLFVPQEFSFGPVDTTQEENPDEDPLIKEFQETMARAIREPGSAEAMAPFIMRAPGITQSAGGAVPTAELIRWIQLGPQDRYAEGEMWDKTISRIAGGVDMPKELMTGVGDVSHWGQWFLDDIGFRQHTGPTVIRFCNDIAAAYLRPAAIEEGIKNAENVTMWFDPSQAVNHPDETGVVRDAHKELVVSDAYYREKIGAPEDAAPKPKELERRVEILLKQNPFADESQPTNGATPPQQGGRGGDVTEAPPTDSQQRPPGTKPPSPAGPNLTAMIVGAAQMQVDRARELAGNRLMRKAQSCEECQGLVKEVSTALVASALGPDQVQSLISPRNESFLVDGIGKAFAERVRAWHIDGGWPDKLGEMVEQHAVRTLYEREVPPLPPGFMAAARKATS